MAAITAASLEAAVQRLRGHIVATPLIGTPWLGSAVALPDVRWKPEGLQPGASAWWRGYQHFLLRQLGRCAGLVYAGPPSRLLAAALAAQQHRLALFAFVAGEVPADLRALLPVEVQLEAGGIDAAATLARRRGFTLLPGVEDLEVLHGLATIGWELAQGLPQACQRVFASAALAPALEAGLAAAGRPLPVLSPAATQSARPGLSAAVACGHGLTLGATGLAALSAALAAPATACVAAVVSD